MTSQRVSWGAVACLEFLRPSPSRSTWCIDTVRRASYFNIIPVRGDIAAVSNASAIGACPAPRWRKLSDGTAIAACRISLCCAVLIRVLRTSKTAGRIAKGWLVRPSGARYAVATRIVEALIASQVHNVDIALAIKCIPRIEIGARDQPCHKNHKCINCCPFSNVAARGSRQSKTASSEEHSHTPPPYMMSLRFHTAICELMREDGANPPISYQDCVAGLNSNMVPV